jgi:hypothetical protein
MRIQPRHQILDVWRAVARQSYHKGVWQPGGRYGSNSISDAEQLLCILGPATEVPLFGLDNPDAANEDVLDALVDLGDSIQVPQRLIRALTEYLRRYTDEDGTPLFAGGGYFSTARGVAEEVRPEQRGLDVVDSFSVSIQLMLATIGFLRVFRDVVRRPALREQVDELEAMASTRLTAAMVGLLRSFAINVFSTEEEDGIELLAMVNQERRPGRQVADELREALSKVNARLRDDVTIGSGSAEGSDLDLPNRLFECGWSWGIVQSAPEVETTAEIGTQRDGAAQNAPYQYFTTVALDAIAALSSERTWLLGLLDEAQLKLSQSLQLRSDLTRSYWDTIARFGSGQWPLEDIPWRTTDGVESDYLTLLVSGLALKGMGNASDSDLIRVARVLEELAKRSRITQRAATTKRESALDTHFPGLSIDLVGSDKGGGPTLTWTVTDISPLLLQRVLTLARMVSDGSARSRLLDLSDELWLHLRSRMFTRGEAGGLWDRQQGAFPQLPELTTEISWYFTKRVVDCLVTAAKVIADPPVPSLDLAQLADHLLHEAEHLYDRERLNGSTYNGQSLGERLKEIDIELERARSVRRERPGVAVAVTQEVLRKLDHLSAARRAARSADRGAL